VPNCRGTVCPHQILNLPTSFFARHGEAALDVHEQLGLDQLLGDGAQLYFDKTPDRREGSRRAGREPPAFSVPLSQ